MHVFGLRTIGMPAALGLVLGLAGMAGVGCEASDTKTGLHPEGLPEVLQMFIYENAADGPQQIIGYGDHAEWTGPVGYAESAIVSNSVNSQRVRLVMDELLTGNTLEQFKCACNATGLSCPAGAPLYSPLIPCDGAVTSCAPGCTGDAPETSWSEVGQFADTNFDGVPDTARLLPGIISVVCGSHVWTNDLTDGFWSPSGNQLVPGLGPDKFWDQVGPAVVVEPNSADWPTGSDCHFDFADTVTDKDGNAVDDTVATVDPATGEETIEPRLTFTTEALTALSFSPADGETDVPFSAGSLQIMASFNAAVSTTLANNVVTVTASDGTVVAGTVSADGYDVVWVPDADLAVSTTYDVVITTSVTDSYGVALPTAITFSFTTAAE